MAASIFEVAYSDTQSYINPEVSMPKAEMVRYAWAVYGSKRKYNQVVSNAHGMKLSSTTSIPSVTTSLLIIPYRTRRRLPTTLRNFA